MPVKIQLRRGTVAEWTSVNPVLLSGELGLETDTNKKKIGDGSTPWNSLPYEYTGATGGATNQIIYDNDIIVIEDYTLRPNKNAMSAGPLTIAESVTVTVPSGQSWTIV